LEKCNKHSLIPRSSWKSWFPKELNFKKKKNRLLGKRKGHTSKQKRNNKMKRKGRHTLEVIMWVWVCYNREVLLLCTPPYILLMTAHHTYHQSCFWHHKTCSYYSTMIKSGFTIQNLELVSGPQIMRLYCLFGMES
jgi:hypothetical protein